MTKITLQTSDLLNYPEAANLLGVSRQSIYNFIEQGDLFPVVIGRARFLLREDVLRLKARREKQNPSFGRERLKGN